MKAADLIDAIRWRFGRDKGWCLLPEVEAPLVEDLKGRRLDAVAFGLWSSNWGRVHGFEIKTTRADWLSELDDPSKSEPGVRATTDWWIVAPPDVAQKSELPAGWGWLELRGETLRLRRRATRRVDVDTAWLFERATKRFVFDYKQGRANAIRDAEESGYQRGRDAAKVAELSHEQRLLIHAGEQAQELVERFGQPLWKWSRAKAEAVLLADRLLSDRAWGDAAIARLRNAARASIQSAKSLREVEKRICDLRSETADAPPADSACLAVGMILVGTLG